ncbi:DUF2004 domain-containing protein [Flaviaesturariibacter amylovorans]|uniref:DUF2004 domain-containing protein n=1 Tax=Flaviaesturariibacter amylovorans TaxID=1084520 RepID=A0ABP8H946_9BACT
MATYTLPYFGAIDTGAPEEFYDAEATFGNGPLSLDLNVDEASVAPESLDKVKRFLEDLPALDRKARALMAEDFHGGGDTVTEYLEHHSEELGNALDPLLEGSDAAAPRDERLLKALRWVRAGFYPNDEEVFATLDYSLGEDLTQYLIVVNLDANGELAYMTMES